MIRTSVPSHLSPARQALLRQVALRLESNQADSLLGIVLTGSAGRELDNARSDLDVLVILNHVDDDDAVWVHSAGLDVIPLTIEHLETVASFDTPEWGYRWTYAWAQVLLDRSGGRIPAALERQTRLTLQEINSILVDHEQLGSWINLLYRALKSARDGNDLAARLDGSESVPKLLDVIFALHGLVRPYNKYLRWSLENHPLPNWHGEELLNLIQRTMAGDPDAMRRIYARVHDDCLTFDHRHGQELLGEVFEGWASESYQVLRAP
jgi:hypothetical protein